MKLAKNLAGGRGGRIELQTKSIIYQVCEEKECSRPEDDLISSPEGLRGGLLAVIAVI